MANDRMTKLAKNNAKRIAAYKEVFKSPEGQEVLKDLMSNHWIQNTTFDEANPRKTIFREGERNVVLRILTILETDLKAYQERIKSYEES